MYRQHIKNVPKNTLIIHRAIRKRDKYFSDKRQSERKNSMKNEISTVSTGNATDTVQELEKAYGSDFETKLQKSKSVKSGGTFTFCSTFSSCFFFLKEIRKDTILSVLMSVRSSK